MWRRDGGGACVPGDGNHVYELLAPYGCASLHTWSVSRKNRYCSAPLPPDVVAVQVIAVPTIAGRATSGLSDTTDTAD